MNPSDNSQGVQSALMTTAGNFDAIVGSRTEATQLDESPTPVTWEDHASFDPYFDYSTFARPWNCDLGHTVDSSDWFSAQFFAALRETEPAYSPSFQAWNSDMDVVGSLYTNNIVQNRDGSVQQPLGGSTPDSSEPQTGHILSGRESRVSSPPNESSHEDRLPFAWDPKSKRIARAKPIELTPDDPIFANLDPSVAISQASLSRIQAFLRPLRPSDEEDTFTLPELRLVNVFVGLFLNKFAAQAPVLHRPTLDVEVLPSPLITIMMVIGSCYSRLRRTRRFGIVVLDRARQNLLALIEEDNSLMREPMIIYAAALICYMGLWCGNKRAFELAEALRGVVVTYIRRLPTGCGNDEGHAANTQPPVGSMIGTCFPMSSPSQWSHWAKQESQKRLRWFVYMIDAQFPAVLGMSGMLTLADVRKWEFPCDEDFWTVPTAKAWKHRLGSASEPSCPMFGLLAATVLSLPDPPSVDDVLPRLNTWSANLLLATIMSEIFHYQERLVVHRGYKEDSRSPPDHPISNGDAARLLGMLNIWYGTYNEHQTDRPTAVSVNFVRTSTITYHLA